MEHLFDVDEARRLGVDAAIMVRHLRFWILKNKADKRHHYEGRTWTYGSVKSFSEIFGYWSYGRVRKILKNLIDKKVLRTGHFNRAGYDRTTWYCFEDEKAYLQSKTPICSPEQIRNQPKKLIRSSGQMLLSKPANGFVKTSKPIQDVFKDKSKDRGKGPRKTHEDIAAEKFQQAKTLVKSFPPGFLIWFEKEVLGRWDKFNTSIVILRDWHNFLWAKYPAELVQAAIEDHAANFDAWQPKLSKIRSYAKKIDLQNRVNAKRQKTVKDQRGPKPKPGKTWTETMLDLEKTDPAEFLKQYNKNGMNRAMVDRPGQLCDALKRIKSQEIKNETKN